MKILCFRQPWASAILNHNKDVENRTWRTHYRGPLIIHASARPEGSALAILSETGRQRRPLLSPAIRRRLSDDDFPNGVIPGVVELYDVVTDSNSNWADSDSVYHWLMRNPRKLPQPIPFKGRLGFIEPPASVVRAINKIL